MIEKLVQAKNEKLAEYKKMQDVLATEKRSAFNNDERDKANALKLDLENLNEQIKIEEAFETEKRSTVSKVDVNVPINVKDDVKATVESTELNFRNFFAGKTVDTKFLKDGKFQIPVDYQTVKRSTITTSSNPAFTKTETLDTISVQNSDLVLQKAGAVKYVFESNHGSVKAPSMSQLRGVFVAEGASTSELNPTTAAATLTPTLLVVPMKVSKAFIATQSAANFSSFIAQMFIGIDNGLEYKGFQQLSGLTAISTASGSTLYAGVLAQEENVIGAGTAYVFSRTGTSRAKGKFVNGAASDPVWKSNEVNSYPAYRSSILSDVRPNDAYFGNFKDVAMATFGPISIEMVSDSTLALSGEVLIVVSVMADAKVINSASFSRIANVHQLA